MSADEQIAIHTLSVLFKPLPMTSYAFPYTSGNLGIAVSQFALLAVKLAIKNAYGLEELGIRYDDPSRWHISFYTTDVFASNEQPSREQVVEMWTRRIHEAREAETVIVRGDGQVQTR